MDNYLTDRRDQLLFGVAPTIMAPIYGELDPVDIGRYRYVMARDGLYIEARSNALHVILRLFENRFPYGPMKAKVTMVNGLIPRTLIEACLAGARQSLPNEWGGLILEDGAGGYRLYTTENAKATSHRLTYHVASVAPESIMLDIHSHGTGSAFFSALDDADDQGFYIAAVLGRVHQERPEVKIRLCLHGRHFDIDWFPWEHAEI